MIESFNRLNPQATLAKESLAAQITFGIFEGTNKTEEFSAGEG
jgi:hypothetical protein